MAKLYYIKVVNGSMTLDDVPDKWRGEVKAMLDKEVTNG